MPHRKLEVADGHTWFGKTSRKIKQLDKAVRHDEAACTIFTDLLATEQETAEYAIRLTHAEVHLASDHMSYKVSDADARALQIFARASQRVTKELDATPGQQSRIADLLAAIDANVATLKRRSRL